MIITQINGGLGNQLFQYAAGRALAEYHQVPLKIENSFYKTVDFASFELERFNAQVQLASVDEIEKFNSKNFFTKACSKILPVHKKIFFVEPYSHFYNKFFSAPSNSYLKGLWQSEKYFSSIKDTIRHEFILKDKLVIHLRPKAEAMRKENSVAVHIRRGDYTNPNVEKVMGLLRLDYYKKALSLLQKKTGNLKVYFFSDDIEFVGKNMTLNYDFEFVSGAITSRNYEDFYLMQHCKHNIIANSTFSWWSAYLNNYNEKIVVAPKNWFNTTSKNSNDLLPEAWYKL
ncbi:alpha-1,2-fucosyltransferase [Segetibacter aerophilus]|uniref:Alpha-1,2-fucosyltransferase n=1 Tax=Segetibacter aerophilus TaxID=670293 RepID=A0A512BAY8_9BACT|nr:alpha-1,2-fucosyltransferase [Segetibacter aerophilus]GEO09128.1 alpha-1,2-fucosyltransferase [Segetibacter aerophilus]